MITENYQHDKEIVIIKKYYDYDCHYPVTFDDNFDACVHTICNYKVMICDVTHE